MTTTHPTTHPTCALKRRPTHAFKPHAIDADVALMDTLTDHNARTGKNEPRRDSGSSFHEVLIAIVLMGFAFSAVIGGIRAVIAASSTSDETAKVEAVLNSASDRLANWTYTPCPGPNGEAYAPVVEAAKASVGWAAYPNIVTIMPVKFWDPSLNAGGAESYNDADGGWVSSNSLASGDCNEDINLTTSRTLQKVTIRVSSPDGDVVRTLDVVKSNIVADPTPNTTP